MSWASQLGGDISQGFQKGLGALSQFGSNVAGAANGIGGQGTWLNQKFSDPLINNPGPTFGTEMSRFLGNKSYDALNPGGMSVHNKGLFKNPWGAARLGALLFGGNVMNPGMLGGPGMGGGGLGGFFSNGVSGLGSALSSPLVAMHGLGSDQLYNAYRRHDDKLKQREQYDAMRARNLSLSESGVAGLPGTSSKSSADQDAQAVMARYSAMRQQAQMQYMQDMMDQFNSFMGMAGAGVGGAFGGNSGGGY